MGDARADMAERLAREFGPGLSVDEIRRELDDAFARFADARFDTFVPVLAERGVRHRLRERGTGPRH